MTPDNRNTLIECTAGTIILLACLALLGYGTHTERIQRDPCATIRTCTPNPSGECAPIRRGPVVCGCVVVQGWWEDRVVCWEVAP